VVTLLRFLRFRFALREYSFTYFRGGTNPIWRLGVDYLGKFYGRFASFLPFIWADSRPELITGIQ